MVLARKWWRKGGGASAAERWWGCRLRKWRAAGAGGTGAGGSAGATRRGGVASQLEQLRPASQRGRRRVGEARGSGTVGAGAPSRSVPCGHSHPRHFTRIGAASARGMRRLGVAWLRRVLVGGLGQLPAPLLSRAPRLRVRAVISRDSIKSTADVYGGAQPEIAARPLPLTCLHHRRQRPLLKPCIVDAVEISTSPSSFRRCAQARPSSSHPARAACPAS